MAVLRSDLQCMVERAEYDFDARTGYLWMEKGNACDMTACVNMFEAIDAEVRIISTYAGDVPGAVYRRTSGDWQAFRRD